MRHAFGYPHRHWHHQMGWPRRYYRGWGYRRPCCLFLTLPVLLVPLLALLFLGFRALHVM